MNIEAGMFIRTYNGIDKIIELKSFCKERDMYHIITEKDEIVFGSGAINNTILFSNKVEDLIREGDSLKFIDILGNESYVIVDSSFKMLRPEYLKEILTKEQYESNVYKL